MITQNSTISRGMNCSLAKYGKEEVSRGGVVASSLLIAAFKWANDIKNLVHFVSYIQQMTASKWSVHNSLTLLNFFGTCKVEKKYTMGHRDLWRLTAKKYCFIFYFILSLPDQFRNFKCLHNAKLHVNLVIILVPAISSFLSSLIKRSRR